MKPSSKFIAQAALGLVFIAGTFDSHLRALDIETGKELWRAPLPAGGNATLAATDMPDARLRAGDTLVVSKLDRLARSVPDARAIGDGLAGRGIKLSLGGQVYDPADPMGKMFFNILATFAEFEVDLLRMRTREGMAVARAKGKLRGKQPKLSARQQRELARMAATGDYTIADLAEMFTVSRATVYRTLQRAPAADKAR